MSSSTLALLARLEKYRDGRVPSAAPPECVFPSPPPHFSGESAAPPFGETAVLLGCQCVLDASLAVPPSAAVGDALREALGRLEALRAVSAAGVAHLAEHRRLRLEGVRLVLAQRAGLHTPSTRTAATALLSRLRLVESRLLGAARGRSGRLGELSAALCAAVARALLRAGEDRTGAKHALLRAIRVAITAAAPLGCAADGGEASHADDREALVRRLEAMCFDVGPSYAAPSAVELRTMAEEPHWPQDIRIEEFDMVERALQEALTLAV